MTVDRGEQQPVTRVDTVGNKVAAFACFGVDAGSDV